MPEGWVDPPRTWTNTEVPGKTEMDQEIRDRMMAIKLAIEGDLSAFLTQAHKEGTYALRPAAGNAGRLYFATDLGALFRDNGSVWRPVGFDPVTCEHFFEEFAGHPYGDTPGAGGEYWTPGTGDAWATADIDPAGDDDYSIAQLKTGTTAGNSVRLAARQSIEGYYRVDRRVPALLYLRAGAQQTTGNLWAGLTDSSPGAAEPTNGIFLRKLTGANWKGVCRAAGVETTVELLASNDTAYRDFLVEIKSASAVAFYAGDTQVGGDVTTNIPTTARLGLMLAAYSADAIEDMLNVDYTDWYARRAAAA